MSIITTGPKLSRGLVAYLSHNNKYKESKNFDSVNFSYLLIIATFLSIFACVIIDEGKV